MERELLDKIYSMLHSEDEEMVTLARRLFWMNDPSTEDYEYVQKSEWKNSEDSWRIHKSNVRKNIEEFT